MASPTVDSTSIVISAAADDVPLQVDSIPILDIRLLSQSELYSLSLCSSSAVGPLRCDDVVVPKIDRSVFNESAGSRKQTYSRYRLAPASSSSSATSSAPRRRTPHLRPTPVTIGNNGNSVPEKKKNSQIIDLLKQLFVTNSNPEDLIPVKIDYSYSLPQQLSSFPSSSSSNVVPVNHKRKRGHPCQFEIVKNNANSTLGVNPNVDSYDGNRNKNGSIMSENVGDVDRDRKALLNRDGVEVDLVALGTVENPYAEEIKQRTEGLNGKEDLVRFLEGLNGKWGSSRKKRRIVDASMFGSTLPVGWNLLLSLKKKKGCVWLYCGHYLSPSGRQFVSCKDISSYLLSLHCAQDTNKVDCAENNQSMNDSNSLSSVSIANVNNQDDNRKKNLICPASSLIVSSTSSNHEMQVTLDAGDQPEDTVGKFLHCDECKMTFSQKDDLLHHQSSLHREKMYKNDLSLNDVVIVKEGNCEHVFTCSTFNKVNNFNDHIGAHERNHVKSTEESLSVDVGVCVEPGSFCQQPVREVMLKGSLGSIGNNMGETSNVNTSDHVGDRIATDGNFGVYEFLPSNNESKSFHEVGVQNTHGGSLLTLSDHERIIGTEYLVDKVCRRKMEMLEVDGVQNVRTSEPFLSVGSHTELNSDAVIGIEEDKIVRHCSPSAFETEKNIMIENDVIQVISSVAEECKQEPSGSVLLTESCAAEVSNEAYTANKISTTSVNDPKLHEIENPRNHNLSLSSGHLLTEFHTKSDTVEQEKNLLGSISVQSGTERTFGFQNNFSNNESSAVEDAKCGKPLGFGLLGSSINNKTCELGTSFGMNYYSGRDQDGPRGNQIGNSGTDFIIGFGRNNLQPVEDVLAEGIWTTGQENILQGSFTATTSPQVQPSSSFHAFDIMSDQDAQGLFEVQEKYNINANVEGMSSGRAEPVEYSFLGSNSSNVIPMESSAFSHNTNMEQGLDSSFWLGNNALMPNTTDNRSKSSSVCVWCRNVFYHETNQPEMEATGAIGSMCPACSTRIPGHFSVL
ncbi:unnamed protein product [Fraxinus pennsylvanica]|uniref:C2H2-type domain-containing protein n=1 Tax=Fraxinus pennsylvanica TaxID=56036 RepID=A0AAD1YLW6_9LAMI|nr:unnamed protein product [Fraxinus pennsylvanica]